MKKYVLLVVLISLVSYNLICNEERKVSELVLANAEALAGGETASPDCPSSGNGCLSNGLWWPCLREPMW